MKDSDLALFQRNVRSDVDLGADPTVAATTRARGLVAPRRASAKAVRVASPLTNRVQFPVYSVSGKFMRRVMLLGAVVFASRVLPAQQVDTHSIPAKSRYSLESFAGKKPLTRAERTNFTETSHYDDVIVFIDSLKKLGAKISTGSIAKTSEGRDLPYVIASRPLVATPAEARRLNRPVAYIQANIHAGEVEGKEAMQALLRDLLFDKKKNVLDSIVLIVQPIYNADGNEKWGAQERNRGAQNGPEQVGTRQNASGWNLNRDYIGADAPETRGSLAALNKWNPDLFMDLHTTDGSIHGYALTYSPTLTPTAVNILPYTANTMLPVIRQRMRDRHGFEVQDYGDFSRPGVPRGGGRGAARGAPGAAPGGAPGRGADSAAGRGAARARRWRRWRRGGPSLEQMIADSIPQWLGVLDVRIVGALRHELLRPSQSHRDFERGVLARSIRPSRRLDVRLRHRDSVVPRRT